jgi:D-alanyl-D-alanine carboxypeptidase
VIIVAPGYQVPKSLSSPSVSPSASLSVSSPSDARRRDLRGAVGEADGVAPGGVGVFDDATPAVRNLDAGPLKAVGRAATDAAADGVAFYVTSGRRSSQYQDRLLRQAVAKYGSGDGAARRVATAATSPHVPGDAVDIGHADAMAWLSRLGPEFGLSQIYRNEPCHDELRTTAIDRGCPRMCADPTQDPRMQQ